MDRRRLRILFLAPQPFFEVHGTPLAVLYLTRALAGLGHQIDLLTFAQGEPAPTEGVRYLRSLRLPVGRVKAGPSLAKLLLDVPFMAEAVWRLAFGRYEVVHAVDEAAHLVAPFARLLHVPLVMDVDSSIPDQLRCSGSRRGGPLPWLAEQLERQRAASRSRGRDRVHEPHRRREAAGAGRRHVPRRGPAAMVPQARFLRSLQARLSHSFPEPARTS
jgi:Glycosyl transferase 4-like domain